MKGLRIATLTSFVVIVFLSVGLVSALSSSDASIYATLSNSSPKPGDTVLVSVTFQSKVSEVLKIYAIGVHADWMQKDQLFGPNLSSNPATVEANGVYVTQFTMQIPTSASLGSHTYRVGVDVLDSSNNYFSFDSAEATIQVVASSSTRTPSTSGGASDGDATDWLPWIVVAAAAAIVVVIVLFVMMKSKKPRKPAVEQTRSEEPMPPASEEPKPDEEEPSKDFNI